VALVTGASRGIGRTVALNLVREGFHVIAVGRSQKALESLDDEIKAQGAFASLVPMDLKDFPAIDRLGGVIYERWGKLDALAAIAGALGELTPVFDAPPAMMEEVMATNVLANHRLIRAMDPLLRTAQAGRAVFVTSGAAKNGRAYWGPYAASKAALDALVTAYAAETAITAMKINLFDPGPVRTAMRAKAMPGEDPLTLPSVEDVAPAIVNLLRADCTLHGQRIRFERPA
jgi:NAD(P)-dependent dehydrogenase (short-subunit alcohol dehydrogenase family)